MNSIDYLHLGKIKYSDFLVAALDKKGLLDEELLFLTFQHFDADGDNFINVLDLKMALENAGDRTNMEEIEGMIADWDMDNNRQIDFEEFKRMMAEVKEPSIDLAVRSNPSRAKTVHKTLAKITNGYED